LANHLPENVAVVDSPDEQRYEILADGELAGFAEYRPRPGRLVFTHTETLPGFEGHGLASRLIRDALDDVRRRGLKATPVCPFVRRFIEDHPEYADLVAEQ